jgi:hypothetical protein
MPTYLQNPKFHADPCCNQLPIATATATQPQMGLENVAIKVGYSRPRQLLTKQKQKTTKKKPQKINPTTPKLTTTLHNPKRLTNC